jgi:hypothetical protein
MSVIIKLNNSILFLAKYNIILYYTTTMASRFTKMTQTTIFIIVAVVVSIILLSYFNINMTTDDTLKLNRYAIYEGFKENNDENKKDEKNKKNTDKLLIF